MATRGLKQICCVKIRRTVFLAAMLKGKITIFGRRVDLDVQDVVERLFDPESCQIYSVPNPLGPQLVSRRN